MRILGIDYGSKRIGLAVSDEEGILARPLFILENKKSVIEQIKQICQKEEIGQIVIGLPIRLKGGESPQTKEVTKFAQELRQSINIPIAFENEIFTTKIAKEVSRKKVDQRAAQIILQSYLDRQK